MRKIINSRIKKSRVKKEKFEQFKIKLYSHKVIKDLRKTYKNTGQLVIELDPYKYKEDKLIKVLELLKSEKQIEYKEVDDMYIVTILLKSKDKIINHLQSETKEKPLETIASERTQSNQKSFQPKSTEVEDDEVLKF